MSACQGAACQWSSPIEDEPRWRALMPIHPDPASDPKILAPPTWLCLPVQRCERVEGGSARRVPAGCSHASHVASRSGRAFHFSSLSALSLVRTSQLGFLPPHQSNQRGTSFNMATMQVGESLEQSLPVEVGVLVIESLASQGGPLLQPVLGTHDA